MNDFDYDVLQKKRVAANARRRVCGSKSKFCGLPSDHLTNAQWKQKNGEVISVNFNQPISWNNFKKLSKEVQKEYVEKCIENFDCKISNFAEIFGVQYGAIKAHFVGLGIDMGTFRAGQRMSKENRKRFDLWLHPPEISKAAEMRRAPNMELPTVAGVHFDMEYYGLPDLPKLVFAMSSFAQDGPVRIRIIMDRVKESE